ncbi:MAG: hypothetical protein JW936_03335 [Sedimentisphaerales bacterium]|nr:hypothetical protein [Sedimentisphaerales bacterium]
MANRFSWKSRVLGVVLLSLSFCSYGCGDCPQFEAGESLGNVESPLINEASGLAASRQHAGVLWAHNDSGDSARIFALAEDGTHLGVYNIVGATARDWEDIAIGPSADPNQDYIYIGEIGDNNAVHSSIVIYRVPEPEVDVQQSPVTVNLGGMESITLTYPDGARDAETLLVDPNNNDIYIVSKREALSRVYRVAAPEFVGESITMSYVCNLPWGWAVGGDVSPNGSEVIVRGYTYASLWQRPAGELLWEAFTEPACSLGIISEPQGEAICFDRFGCGYLTTSENSYQPIYYFARVHTGDVNGDCSVNLIDYEMLCDCWLGDGSGVCLSANLDGQDGVDLVDLALLASGWLR